MAKIAINAHLLSFDATYRNTGVSRYLHRLIENIISCDGRNEYVIFMSRRNWKPGVFPQKKNIRFCLTRFNTRNSYIRIGWENIFLPVALLLQRIDVYHAPMQSLPLLCPVRSVATVFDLTVWTVPQTHHSRRNFYVKYCLSRAVKRSRAVVAISDFTKADLVGCLGVSPERIQVISLAAGTAMPQTDNFNGIRKKYNLPGRFVLHLSTIEPRKNISRLLEAFSLMLEKKPQDISLVIAGPSGWKEGGIYSKVKEYGLEGKVVFTGFVDEEDLPLLYGAAELFVYISVYEGFGMPVLEAMQSGVPVIASNTSAIPQTAGGAAYYVDPENADEIASAMDVLLSSEGLRRDFIKKGYEQVKKFSWKKTALETISLYEAVCRGAVVASGAETGHV